MLPHRWLLPQSFCLKLCAFLLCNKAPYTNLWQKPNQREQGSNPLPLHLTFAYYCCRPLLIPKEVASLYALTARRTKKAACILEVGYNRKQGCHLQKNAKLVCIKHFKFNPWCQEHNNFVATQCCLLLIPQLLHVVWVCIATTTLAKDCTSQVIYLGLSSLGLRAILNMYLGMNSHQDPGRAYRSSPATRTTHGGGGRPGPVLVRDTPPPEF